MTTSDIELHIVVSDADVGAERLDAMTVDLIHDLRALGVESVQRAAAAPPEAGAKGAGATTGALNVVAAPNIAERLVGFLRAWSSRGQRIVKIETPDGLRLEFPTDKALTPPEMAAFIQALTAGPVTAPPRIDPAAMQCRVQLRELLMGHFDESEVRTLCFYLGIGYEDLSGGNRSEKILSLITYVERYNRIADLLASGRKRRLEISWDGMCSAWQEGNDA